MTNGALSILRIVMTLALVAVFSDGALAQARPAPPTTPPMTEELMGR